MDYGGILGPGNSSPSAISSEGQLTSTEEYLPPATSVSLDDMICKLMTGDERGSNAVIFKDQDILNPNKWKDLEKRTHYES
jgi:hypothetical protein